MQLYYQIFVNYKQNNLSKLFSIVKFVDNNIKNINTNYIF